MKNIFSIRNIVSIVIDLILTAIVVIGGMAILNWYQPIWWPNHFKIISDFTFLTFALVYLIHLTIDVLRSRGLDGKSRFSRRFGPFKDSVIIAGMTLINPERTRKFQAQVLVDRLLKDGWATPKEVAAMQAQIAAYSDQLDRIIEG